MKNSVLIIDDEPLMRFSIADALKRYNYQVVTAEDGIQGIEIIEKDFFDIIITDLRLPGADGIEILKKVKEKNLETAVILITAFGTVDTAVQALKSGAYDYITKPFNLDELILIIQRYLSYQSLKNENLRLKNQLDQKNIMDNIIGKSPQIHKIYELIDLLSRTDATVLIEGETGTGKELIASAIHFTSSRKNSPYIKVNCAALPESLLESELFGHEKGAFTGAIRMKPGRFELADTGTLFLDEISDLPLFLQAKLLRVLQEKEFERVGGTRTLKVDVRIICASKNKLKDLVDEGSFRDDLYFRLNVIPIYMAPLKERKDDIIPLTEYFLNKYAIKENKEVIGVDPEVFELFINYSWPGNVRELENIILRAITLTKDKIITLTDIPQEIIEKTPKPPEFKEKPILLSMAMEEAEKEHIIRVLEITKGQKNLAADILGISRTSLWKKIKQLKID